jgi:hypothetical protein
MTTYFQTAIEESVGASAPAWDGNGHAAGGLARPLYVSPRYASVLDSMGGGGTADTRKLREVQEVLAYIRATAAQRAKSPRSVEPSRFLDRLRDYYLKSYLAAPSPAAGKTAIDGIGKTFGGPVTVVGGQPDRWEEGALQVWNKQEIPGGFRKLRPDLPPVLAAATDILSVKNRAILPAIDIPHLVGALNLGTGFDDDWTFGGKNISQLMHWGTGVKYSDIPWLTMRELFLGYELWHLEGFDVFGEDSINDLIAEEAGRVMGVQLRKGALNRDNLVERLNFGFTVSRAWVGSLLRARKAQFEEWILLDRPRPAQLWWGKLGAHQLWGPQTILGFLRIGMSVDSAKTMPLTEKIIDIYTLIYAADEWERTQGKIPSTKFMDAMLAGKFDTLFRKMAHGEKPSIGELRDAAGAAGAPTS